MPKFEALLRRKLELLQMQTVLHKEQCYTRSSRHPMNRCSMRPGLLLREMSPVLVLIDNQRAKSYPFMNALARDLLSY